MSASISVLALMGALFESDPFAGLEQTHSFPLLPYAYPVIKSHTWWIGHPALEIEKLILPNLWKAVTTDDSLRGWGVVFQSLTVQGTYLPKKIKVIHQHLGVHSNITGSTPLDLTFLRDTQSGCYQTMLLQCSISIIRGIPGVRQP